MYLHLNLLILGFSILNFHYFYKNLTKLLCTSIPIQILQFVKKSLCDTNLIEFMWCTGIKKIKITTNLKQFQGVRTCNSIYVSGNGEGKFFFVFVLNTCLNN